MSKSEKQKELIDENHGYLITSQALQRRFTKTFIPMTTVGQAPLNF